MFQNVVKEQLRVPAKIEYLGELRDFVTKVGRRHGFSERVINAFKLSIDEAATNIIKHAYRDWAGDITIRSIVKRHSLTIVLIDQGKYFDPRQVGDPDLQRYVDIGKKGGLGIFIMRRLLDDIDYRKTEEGNELLLFKNRDVARKRSITVPSIPLSLKARYWLISAGVYALLIMGIYAFFFIQQDERILVHFLDRGRNISYILSNDIATNLEQLSPESKQQFIKYGSQMDTKIGEYAARPVNNVMMSEYRDLVFSAFVVDNSNTILASLAEDSVLRPFKFPQNAKLIQKQVYLYKIPAGPQVVDIAWPVVDEQKTVLCNAHILIDNSKIKAEIKSARLYYLNLVLLVLVIGLASLFLFIYIIMNPFRRLQEWVKALGQPGVAEEMDIDASTEVGEIAQAFSDITQQLRDSQKNLAEQERLQKEMQVAKEIQQTLLPSEVPEIEGYEIASYYAAAKEVGGDYFDFIEVDKDTLGIVVGDVSGKGVPGSLVMTMIRTALRTEARGVKDAAEVLTRVNDFIVHDMKKGMFVTLFYVIIDSKRRRLNYASAGHNPMILYRASTGKTFYLNPRGFPIGISLPDKNLFKNSIESDTIALAEDDILMVYTDGITEAMNLKRYMFGEERFLNVIRKHGKTTAKEFVDELHQEILSFTEGYPQSDDITLVAIKEKASAEKIELGRAKKAYEQIQQGLTIKEACETAGLSIYAYNKYRDQFDKEGVETFTFLTDAETVEAKHLSIEEKTKIFDVIRRFPEYGAKRINEELNTQRYGFTEISAAKIYEELVRSRLNTKEMRVTFVARGGRRKRLKPPGTPLLTIDGQVIIQRKGVERFSEDEASYVQLERRPSVPETHEQVEPADNETNIVEKAPDTAYSTEQTMDSQSFQDILTFNIGDLLQTPLEDFFDKRKDEQKSEQSAKTLPVEKSKIQEKADQRVLSEESDQLDSIVSSEEESVRDLEVNEDQRWHRKIENDEKEFADMISDGAGLEEPSPFQENEDTFQGEPIEDVTILSEEEKRTFIEPEFSDPFEEFLTLEGEFGILESEKELDKVLVDRFIQQEMSPHFSETEKNEKTAEIMQFNEGNKAENSDIKSENSVVFNDIIQVLENDAHSTNNDDRGFDQLLLDVVSDILQSEKSTNDNDHFHATVERTGIHGREQIFQDAIQFYERENYGAAIKALEKYVDIYPDDSHAHVLLGNACYRLRKFTEAAKEYEIVIRIDPKNHYAYENLGVVYANQGDLARAIFQWERLLRLSPQRQDIKNSIAKAKKLKKMYDILLSHVIIGSIEFNIDILKIIRYIDEPYLTN